jgi:hypothetical protein
VAGREGCFSLFLGKAFEDLERGVPIENKVLVDNLRGEVAYGQIEDCSIFLGSQSKFYD